MRNILMTWIGGADALQHARRLKTSQLPLDHAYQQERQDDLYLSLVGELFDMMREASASSTDWALIANALGEYATPDRTGEMEALGLCSHEAALFSAAAFYLGGYPASACVAMRDHPQDMNDDIAQACCDLLTKRRSPNSGIIQDLLAYLVTGDDKGVERLEEAISIRAHNALQIGPDEWVPLHLLQSLLGSFRRANLRAVLPDGQHRFWTPLVSSMAQRGIWDFFPSQIEAINQGLLTRGETFSLQMPTGAGKTALCETLLFGHLAANPAAAAVLLVPLRSLASELRHTVVQHLNSMGISARCAYGGTAPTARESRDLDTTRALVATPETLSGVLSAAPEFSQRISLVICDEGHLLDAPTRGVGLELLLARFRSRRESVPRFVFISAIVPNIEEMNAWLGGSHDSVVRSSYRPALAEFSLLDSTGSGTSIVCDLVLHPHEPEPLRCRMPGFLTSHDFRYRNEATGRQNTHGFGTHKSRAIAACRKALAMGPAVVFSANKKGEQGAEGLAEEFIRQTSLRLPVPIPSMNSSGEQIKGAVDYLQREYGPEWIGTRTLAAGAVLHHGDIPQETREVLEGLLRRGHSVMAICTNTLAEGVNLPIRTLVLYSVQRRLSDGGSVDLLTRDIKNLVGRAGRAGATTKGLVICVNPKQWAQVSAVAKQSPGEPVTGALRMLLEGLFEMLAVDDAPQLSNDFLEGNTQVQGLVDGIDTTLIDLAVTEIGDAEFRQEALLLVEQTFAGRHMNPECCTLLHNIVQLRSERVLEVRGAGRLEWIRASGANPRMLDIVERSLFPAYAKWHEEENPLDRELMVTLMDWAWNQPDVQQAAVRYYNLASVADLPTVQPGFFEATRLWLLGVSPKEIALQTGIETGQWLAIYTGVLSYAVQTVVEQGIALIEQLLGSHGLPLGPGARALPGLLRYGVPTNAGSALAVAGVRHRSAYVSIGSLYAAMSADFIDSTSLALEALSHLQSNEAPWREGLGDLVYENTVNDLTGITHRRR